MKRECVYYVMPMGDVWLVRRIGSHRAEAYPTREDAIVDAQRLAKAAGGAPVRVLERTMGARLSA